MKKILFGLFIISGNTAFAALGTLPYKFKIITVTPVGQDWYVTINILDGSNNVIATPPPLDISPSQQWIDIRTALEGPVLDQMQADAGSTQALLTALTGKSISVAQ